MCQTEKGLGNAGMRHSTDGMTGKLGKRRVMEARQVNCLISVWQALPPEVGCRCNIVTLHRIDGDSRRIKRWPPLSNEESLHQDGRTRIEFTWMLCDTLDLVF